MKFFGSVTVTYVTQVCSILQKIKLRRTTAAHVKCNS